MSLDRPQGLVPVVPSCSRSCTVVAFTLWTLAAALGLSVPAQAQDGLPSQAVGMLQIEDVSGAVMQAAQAAVAGPDGKGKNGPLAPVGLELALLYHHHRVAGPKGIQTLSETSGGRPKTSSERRSRKDGGQMLSPTSADGRYVTVDAVASDGVARLLTDLQRLGLENGATVGNVVSGRLPISAITEAAGLSSLRGMVPSYARTMAGSVGSEADTAHAASTARVNKGVDGNGQKVCVLSDSYNNSDVSISATDDINSGDLPGQGNPEGRTTPVDVLDDSYEGTDPEPTDEGRAMLQLVHDIAPGATLGFHTAFGGVGNFASGIRELADVGCTVIVDDVKYSAEPFYQDGPISNAVDDVVNNDGVTYFSSAGNNGQNSYEAPFRNSGETGVISSTSVAHDFDSSTLNMDTRQEVTIEAGGTFQVNLQWTDPSAFVQGSSGADTDLDIALVNENDDIVAQSAEDNVSSGVPFEFFEYENDGSSAETLFLVIEKAIGPDPEEIKYVYSGSGPFTDSDVTINEYDTLGPTIFGHSMAEGAFAVAAAPFFNTSAYNPNADPASLEAFSSKGGIQIRFNQEGDPLGTPEDREKPDIAGTDGVDNTFFGEDLPTDFSGADNIDPDPHPNFFGTSAAAPSIAAIAALIKQARPGLAPASVYSRLEETAADVTERLNRNGDFVSVASGHDPWSGHGFVQAEPAVPAVNVVINTDLTIREQTVKGSDGDVDLKWEQIVREENVTLDAFVIQKGYFEEGISDLVRIESNGAGVYSQTIEDLPVGTHRFRIQGVAETGAGTDSLVAEGLVQVELRTSEVTLTAYPNPFRNDLNLSVTLPEAQNGEQPVTVRVFDVLGRQVAVPVAFRPIRDSESISLASSEIQSLDSGVYFFQVTGETFQQTTKAVRVR